MGFTKLDEGIIFSSIMGEDDSVFRVWIVLLATCKGNGISPISEVFLSSITKKDITEIDRCIKILSSPDGHSRTKNEDGRRIERIDGGFRIINYREYRNFSYTDNTVAERQRRFRSKKELHVTDVTESNGCNGMSRKSNGDISASASASASASEFEEKKDKTKREESKSKSAFAPPTLLEVSQYCLERDNTVDPEKWLSHYTANGWKVGRNPMKDWRAAIRTWENGDKDKNLSYTDQFNIKQKIKELANATTDK